MIGARPHELRIRTMSWVLHTAFRMDDALNRLAQRPCNPDQCMPRALATLCTSGACDWAAGEELLSMDYNAETTMSKTVEGVDCLVIAVAHDRFTRLNLKRIQILMKKPAAIVDMGQVVDPIKAEQMGFVYRGFGRGVWTR